MAPLIRIPLGPGSVHQLLNGLMGLLLGWMAGLISAIIVRFLLRVAPELALHAK